MHGQQTRIPLPKPAGLVAVMEWRAQFKPRTWQELQADREAKAEVAWRDAPQTVRELALRLARINPAQACMPVETLTDGERAELAIVAGQLAKWAEALRKATA